jgi:hypothetical protein
VEGQRAIRKGSEVVDKRGVGSRKKGRRRPGDRQLSVFRKRSVRIYVVAGSGIW